MNTQKVMTRTTFNHILLVAAMIFGCATSNAAAFEATSLKMISGQDSVQKSVDMTLLGKTKKGYQVWYGTSPDTDGSNAKWQVDGSTNISCSTNKFETNKTYKLSATYDASKKRSTPTESTYRYFVKMQTASTADLLIYDNGDAPSAAEEFQLQGNVSIAVKDQGYNFSNSQYSQTIAWTCGLDSQLFKEAVVEASYDFGDSWEAIATSSSLNGEYVCNLAWPQASARFRVTIYPKDDFKILAHDGCWRSEETIDYDFSKITDFRSGTFYYYGAQSVVMNVGMSGTSKDIGMALIGLTRGKGYQVWACHNTTDKTAYALWKIDSYGNILYQTDTYDINTEYHLYYYSDTSTKTRYVSDNSNYTHFIVIDRMFFGQSADINWARYFCWDRTSDLDFASSYYLRGSVAISVDDPVYSAELNCNVQTVKWTCYEVNSNATGKVVIEASYDGGATWATAAEPASASWSGSEVVPIPLKANKVRYRVLVYAKDDYRILVENGYWKSDESADFEQETITVPCSFSISDLKTDFTDSEYFYNRTYSPEVSWEILNTDTSEIYGATLEYSKYDSQTDWTKLAEFTEMSGTQKVNIPVGIGKMAFRMTVKTPYALSIISKDPTDVVTASADYSPEFSAFALKGDLSDNYDESTYTLNPTFTYAMNDDLYQTRQGSLNIYYTTDDGATWTVAGTVASPAQSGEIQVPVPGSEMKYQFRIGIVSEIGNSPICGVESTGEVYNYTPTYFIVLHDDEDYTPMDVTDRTVLVTRSFEADKYESICLPFDLDGDQIEDGFGEGTKMWEFTSASGQDLIFNLVTTLEAGKPYIVKPGAKKDYLLFEHVDINSAATAMERPALDNVSKKYCYYNGTFSPYTLSTGGTEFLFDGDGKVYTTGSSVDGSSELKINGFRAYFKLPVRAGSTAWYELKFSDEISGIDNITVDTKQPIRVYNLRGQYIGNTLEGLPQGVYLVNNQKWVVR